MKPATFSTAVQKLIKFIQCKLANDQIMEIPWEGERELKGGALKPLVIA